MHLCYIDEAGSTGKDLQARQQPVFAMAGLLVSDEKWRNTQPAWEAVLDEYFGGQMPPGFELHAGDLLSPAGQGPFMGHERERRNQLALHLLKLVGDRGHQVLLQLVHKRNMDAATPPALPLAIDWKDPWEVGFAALLTMTEEFLRSGRTGPSSTGLVIIDHDDQYLEVVRSQARDRQRSSGWMQARKVVEIGYSAVSHEHPMIQLADLIAFTMKRWAMSKAGYGNAWPPEAHAFVLSCHELVWPRVEFKRLSFKKLSVPDAFIDYLGDVAQLK